MAAINSGIEDIRTLAGFVGSRLERKFIDSIISAGLEKATDLDKQYIQQALEDRYPEVVLETTDMILAYMFAPEDGLELGTALYHCELQEAATRLIELRKEDKYEEYWRRLKTETEYCTDRFMEVIK